MTTTHDPVEKPYWTEQLGDGRARLRARIAGLHCSLCTGTIERALGRQDGVAQVAVSLTHEQALVDFDPAQVTPEQLIAALRGIGYRVYDPRKLRPYEEQEAELVAEGHRLFTAVAASLVTIALVVDLRHPAQWAVPVAVGAFLVSAAYLLLRGQGRRLAVAGAAGVAALGGVAVGLNAAGTIRGALPWVVGALGVAVVFGLARHIAAMAAQALRRGILNQHVMLEAGALAGLTGGAIGLAFRPAHYPTAAFFGVAVLVVTYHIFSEWLSLLVKTRSSQAVRRLLELAPERATVVRGGVETVVELAGVVVGDLVRVRPGERVPVDGVVLDGHSAVDQALVTGEPTPLERLPGDRVIGGSVNTTGTLLVEVTAVGESSFLAQVVRSVEDARALKPGILHVVDRVLRVYAPTVLAVALLALLGWLAGSYAVTGRLDVQRAVFAGLSVLVMGYPCAVGISAPLSIVRGAAEAADRGVIMRTGEAFQTLRLVRTVVLDKTGTLTEGRPALREVEATDGDPDALLALAAAAEEHSEHPLGRALAAAAFDRELAVPTASDFTSVTGLGVVATVEGRQVLVGRADLLAEHGVDPTGLQARAHELEEAGRTVVLVAVAGQPRGLLALGDELRADAAAAVAGLRAAGLQVVLATGDNPRAAQVMAARAGIQQVHAGMLPGGKAELIRQLQRQARVAMVGDGINDAPALMQADVGIALGAGTDIAVESADVVVVSNQLGAVLLAREVSRRAYRKTRQNVALAFTFNGIGIPAAATGLVYPVWAMAAMAVSVTAIFFNSLWGRPQLLFDAVRSVGSPPSPAARPAGAAQPAGAR